MEKMLEKLEGAGCTIELKDDNTIIARRADGKLYLVMTYNKAGDSYFSIMTEAVYQKFGTAYVMSGTNVPMGVFAYANEWGNYVASNSVCLDGILKFKFFEAESF